MQELNLFIIWQSGEKYINRILSDISDTFEIKDLITLTWSQTDVCSNLTRLYADRNFDYTSPKVKEIGATRAGCRLHVIIIKDANPNFVDGVNRNVLDFKNAERTKYQENYLHGADNQSEAYHNINSLIKIPIDVFEQLKQHSTKYYVFHNTSAGIPKACCSEVVVFESLKQVFSALTDNVNWTVLRNWEALADPQYQAENDDVDILVDDYYKTLLILNARTIHDFGHRVQHHVMVNNKRVAFDIRHISDGYYDKVWEQKMLKNRMFHNGFYHLNEIDHFWSLLYHGIIHKPFLTDAYAAKLQHIGSMHIKKFSTESLLSHKKRFALLKAYLKENNYSITRPADKSVYFIYSFRAYLLQLKNGVIFIVETIGMKDNHYFIKSLEAIHGIHIASLHIARKIFREIKVRMK